MRKILLSILTLSLCLCAATSWAAFTPAVLTAHVDPNDVFTLTPMELFFTAQIARDAQHQPKVVRVLRLQADASLKEVASMWDDGTHGDVKKGDGIYSCMLTVKEPLGGMLAFYIEAIYTSNSDRVRSQPLFVNVIGGASSKAKNEVLRSQEQAGEMLKRLAKEKGLDAAKKETMLWLADQPSVAGVRSAPGRDISVQYRMGITLTVYLPPSQ